MTVNQPQIAIIYDRRKTSTPKKKSSVEIRISYKYVQKYISTGVHILPRQWKNGRVVNTPEAQQLNCTIDTMLSNIRTILLDMGNSIDLSLIPQRLKDKQRGELSFIDFCKERATIREFGKSKDNIGRYTRFLSRFISWGKIKYFTDVTEGAIISYDKYLKAQGLIDSSKWSNYHRFLNSFILDAISEGYLHKNPYKWVNINKGKEVKSLSKHLTEEELGTIIKSKMPTPCLEKVRDVFIFQTYTCLSYIDLKNFDIAKIQEVDGMKVYLGNRYKTGRGYTVPLLKPAMDILIKYNYKLPVISNVKYNSYLKVVAQASGIDKPISSHWARHTGATLLLNKGIDMSIVSKICGHSSTRVTEKVYAKLLDETVVKVVKNLT